MQKKTARCRVCGKDRAGVLHKQVLQPPWAMPVAACRCPRGKRRPIRRKRFGGHRCAIGPVRSRHWGCPPEPEGDCTHHTSWLQQICRTRCGVGSGGAPPSGGPIDGPQCADGNGAAGSGVPPQHRRGARAMATQNETAGPAGPEARPLVAFYSLAGTTRRLARGARRRAGRGPAGDRRDPAAAGHALGHAALPAGRRARPVEPGRAAGSGSGGAAGGGRRAGVGRRGVGSGAGLFGAEPGQAGAGRGVLHLRLRRSQADLRADGGRRWAAPWPAGCRSRATASARRRRRPKCGRSRKQCRSRRSGRPTGNPTSNLAACADGRAGCRVSASLQPDLRDAADILVGRHRGGRHARRGGPAGVNRRHRPRPGGVAAETGLGGDQLGHDVAPAQADIGQQAVIVGHQRVEGAIARMGLGDGADEGGPARPRGGGRRRRSAGRHRPAAPDGPRLRPPRCRTGDRTWIPLFGSAVTGRPQARSPGPPPDLGRRRASADRLLRSAALHPGYGSRASAAVGCSAGRRAGDGPGRVAGEGRQQHRPPGPRRCRPAGSASSPRPAGARRRRSRTAVRYLLRIVARRVSIIVSAGEERQDAHGEQQPRRRSGRPIRRRSRAGSTVPVRRGPGAIGGEGAEIAEGGEAERRRIRRAMRPP